MPGPFDSASIAPNFTTSQHVANDINQTGPSLNLGNYTPAMPSTGSQVATVIWPLAALAAAIAFLSWLFRSKKKEG